MIPAMPVIFLPVWLGVAVLLGWAFAGEAISGRELAAGAVILASVAMLVLARDRLELGPLSATVESLLGHPRLVLLRFRGSSDHVWAGLARHGRAIQYAHVPAPLALWDVWSPIAGVPAAFEPPSAGTNRRERIMPRWCLRRRRWPGRRRWRAGPAGRAGR